MVDVMNEIQERDKKDLSTMPTQVEKEEESHEKQITSFSDKLHLAEQVLKVMPLHYDKAGLWWMWHSGKCKWELIDEVDLMNRVTYSSYANTINSRERGEILQALKQTSRAIKPKDAPISWIQFDSEVIDIETGLRFEATPEYFLTNPIPFKLGKKTETPKIDEIFEQWVGKDYVLLLKQIMAYCLLRDYPIHRIFCFIGSGMNGKSCYLNMLRKFIGEDNVCSTELDTLIASRFEITRVHKKLACQMGETNFNEMSKTSTLKKLSGNDLIGFEYKNKNPFDDKNYAKILIATNNLPTTTDKTIGFYRRWLIIDFPNKFSEKKDILSDIPETEYENLSMQLVGILIDLIKNREFSNEGSIEDRQKKYEDHSNPLEKFMREFVVEDYESHIWKWEFEQKLNDWCKENRFRELSDVVIGKKMKELGILQQQITNPDNMKKWRGWVGLAWKVDKKQDKQEKQVVSLHSSHRESEYTLPVYPVIPVILPKNDPKGSYNQEKLK
jgi:P4 family phage/plasmid primase-like protien